MGAAVSHCCVLPVSLDATASYGRGTASAPAAILEASQQVELWDDEVQFDLGTAAYHTAAIVSPHNAEDTGSFLERLLQVASALQHDHGTVIGLGGEHSVTAPLAYAAAGGSDLSDVTVIQFDAHADLRDTYDGTPHSHACVMHRLVDAGAAVVGIGIRAMSRQEADFAARHERIHLFRAQDLSVDGMTTNRLNHLLDSLTGQVYVTVDVDGLDCALCPATGTPEPGGLPWWTFLAFLKRILVPRYGRQLIGCDVVETVPMPGSQVNEFTAARIVGKMIAYMLAGDATTGRPD